MKCSFRSKFPRGRLLSLAGLGVGLACAIAGSAALAQQATELTPEQLQARALSHTASLNTVTVPDAPNFKQFVRDRTALQILGKALFWDQQLGSDGQACASCHFHAGADNRSKNQVNPGFRNATPGADTDAFNDATGFGPNGNAFGANYQLSASDYPFHRLADVNVRDSEVLSDTNDVTSSQGVFNALFTAIGTGSSAFIDSGVLNLQGPGAVFNVAGTLVRNVEPRNTPTTINAVLNHRNFWDSRARNEFNGNNPIGMLDPTARVVKAVPVGRGKPNNANLVQVSIGDSSAASQADGPPLSDLEMSFAGRRFPELGRKMLQSGLVPLGLQLVANDDSVLGTSSKQRANPCPVPVSRARDCPEASRGIDQQYGALIRQAFVPTWWDAPAWKVDLASGTPKVVAASKCTNPAYCFTVMEYNFSLYFGMAVNEYEKLLVSSETPVDRFLEGDLSALSEPQQRGMALFLDKGKCIACHGGPEFTNASISNVRKFEILERMIMGDDQVAVYDNGHYNIGVRPTAEDLGIGATIGPRNLPLSNSRFFQDCVRKAMAAKSQLTAAAANGKCQVPQILARPDEAAVLLGKAAALLDPADPTRTAAEGLIAEANALLTAVPPDLVEGSCKLAFNAVLCPGNPDGTMIPGAWDLLMGVAPVPAGMADLLAAAASLLPDPVAPGVPPTLVGPPLQPNERVAVDGALKTPGLRNVELTAPYFHNGGQATLLQVVDFYNRGGDFAVANRNNLDPFIQPLGLTDDEKADLVSFLEALTDPRVRDEMAPFDRPSINVPNGGGSAVTDLFGTSCALSSAVCVLDDRVEVPAVGAGGNGVGLGTANTPYANFPAPLTP